MTGISSNALKGTNYPENRKKYNGNELQSKEFGDGSGLEWTDFNARTYDQQIGRFLQIDPELESSGQESWSPYHFSFNNPILYSDPDGRDPILGVLRIGKTIWEIIRGAKVVDQLATPNKSLTVEDILKAFAPITIEDEAATSKSLQTLVMRIEKADALNEKAEGLEKEIKTLEKGIKSHEKTIKEHEQKLEDYKNDPDKHDNKGELKDLNKEQRDRRIDGRVKALERQIRNQKEALRRDQQKAETAKKELDKVNKEKDNLK